MSMMSSINKHVAGSRFLKRPIWVRWTRRCLSLRRLRRAEGGTAAIEFALGVPMLSLLLVPVADLGMAFNQYMQTQQAVQAGALYAANHPWNSKSPSDIANAVLAASTVPGLSAVPAPSQTCGCPTGTSVGAASCNSTCSNGELAGYYVVVNAKSPYVTKLPYSLLGDPATLRAQAIIRIR